jgi:hypothetical protein
MFSNIRREEIPFTFLSLYGYLLVIGEISYNGRQGRELAEVSWRLLGSRFVDSVSGFRLVRIVGSVGRPVWKTATSNPRMGKQTPWVCTGKNCFGLLILNSVLMIVLQHTGRLSSWHLSHTSFEPM